MGDPVNLNKARKAAAKRAEAALAAVNRAKFGRTKAEKAAEQLAEDRRQALLDNVRREGKDPA